MFAKVKLEKIVFLFTFLLFISPTSAEEEEIYLKAISDQIQVITNDLKTLEKAVYQKSDVISLKPSNTTGLDGLNEDIMTKHLLKLNEIENQFRELTNKFEEINFKLDKLSIRVTKIQSDTQLRFSDLENGEIIDVREKKNSSSRVYKATRFWSSTCISNVKFTKRTVAQFYRKRTNNFGRET